MQPRESCLSSDLAEDFFYVDYRELNAITVKNQYSLPLISKTLDRLSRAKIFTKLDVILAFNRLRVQKGDEALTTFRPGLASSSTWSCFLGSVTDPFRF